MMNKLIFFSHLVLIFVLSLTFVTSLDGEFRNKMWVINHGIVHPRILSTTDTRPRRWIDSESEVHVSVSSWLLKIRLNDKLLVSSNFTTRWITSNKSMIPAPVSRDICRILHGHVHNNKNSQVIMTICGDNFYIFFQLDNRSFTVNPIANGSHILEESKLKSSLNGEMNYLQKKKRDLLNIERKSVYNLTGDTFNLDDDNGPKNVERAPESNEHESPNYFSDRSWIKSKLPKKSKTKANDMKLSQTPGWLELGIAVDYSVIDFHGERVQQYVLALFNIVSAIYRDPSLEANLTLVIVRMIFYNERKDGMVRQGNARKSLENVNKWNRNILSLSNKAHDMAVWLTRLDIGGPSGYAPVSGACDPARSCALNRDEGLTSAFIIAHELAHILGLTHDGDETADNFCGREASIGSVMAPMVAATFHRFHWSSCSREEYHRRAKHWTCLNNYPEINNVTQLRDTLHDTFTMDEQCRMEFGDGYELCRSFDLPGICSHLWCSHKNSSQLCKTKKGPPLEGTTCDKNKWCVNGYCEPTDQTMFELASVTNSLRDGGWSEWSSWSRCSTTCGIGVQLRSRQCNTPTLIHGGINCNGSNTDIMICKQTKCSSIVDVRREYCNQLSNITYDRTLGKYKMSWLPYIVHDKNNICRLTCKNADTGRIYINNDFVTDGTPCSYNLSNICIHGRCYLMGCDNVLNSDKHFDVCGICDGDNSTCISISNKFQRNIRRANTRVAIVPAASYDVNIEVVKFPMSLANDRTKFMLRDGRRRKYEMKYFDNYNNSSIVIIEGTEFRMERKLNQYKIYGRGPTLDEVIVSFHTPKNGRKGSTISVKFQYIANREQKNEAMNLSYSWVIGGWSSCSVTCGGGKKRQTIACKNDQTGRIENRKKCLYNSKPVQEIKHCNTFSCQFKWIVSKWEGCTKTCGVHGIQQRQMYCVHSSFPDNEVTNNNTNTVYRVMLPPNICQQHNQPQIQRVCNRFPCRGDWAFTEWSTCSRSCGQGVQSRMARCVSSNGERLFHCDSKFAPDQLRPCKSYGHKPIHSSCREICGRDKSRYCIIPNLKKYCKITDFRKYCCRTCLQKDNL